MGKLLLTVEVVPQSEQRYETCGDWQFKDGTLHVKVSDTGNDLDAFLIGIHEAVEAVLCDKHKVSQIDVDFFDMVEFKGDGEPGEDPRAPYHFEHATAEIVERTIALAANVVWKDYSDRIKGLFKEVVT